MPLSNTEAIVLKKFPSGETSLIVKMYTRKHGNISVMAKGARKIKNRFSGLLEPLNHVSVIFYYHESRDLFMLSQCDLIEAFDSIRESIDRTAVSFAVTETVMNSVIGEEDNYHLFMLIKNVLNFIAVSKKNFLNYYWYFLFKLVLVLGFEILMEKAGETGKNRNLFYNPESGSISGTPGEDAYSELIGVSPETYQILGSFSHGRPESLSRLVISKTGHSQLRAILFSHLSRYVAGFKPPKSIMVYDSIGPESS